MTKASRSRKGAWIEINSAARHAATVASRSRKGAWIEIYLAPLIVTKPNCRSRKGAWIEIAKAAQKQADIAQVAPVRERGLK